MSEDTIPQGKRDGTRNHRDKAPAKDAIHSETAASDAEKEPRNTGKPTDLFEKDSASPREMPFLYLKGFAMGSADVVPGVSGGTMALILGIYARLVFGIKSVDVTSIRQLITLQWAAMFDRIHWKFLISVFLGGISAVFFFTRVVALPVLMHTHPEGVYGLFFGLITGSILLLFRAIGNVGWRELLVMAAGVGIGFRIVTLVPTDTPETSLFVFLSGSLSITAMVLPGISGSFILLILRKYEYILGNIALLGTDRTMEAFAVLIPFGLGMVVGLVLFVRLLSWLIKRYHILTICLLVGFMAGSLYVIWPYQEREYLEISDAQVLPLDHPRVQELLEHRAEGGETQRRRPEYWVLGGVINPGAPAADQKHELVHVRRRMVSSTPYWPDWVSPSDDDRLRKGAQSLYGGLGTMLLGFLLVGWLGRLSRDKDPGSGGLT